jgi:GrpB-like predicted nucleotidyltransferase (UPF0157 family)
MAENGEPVELSEYDPAWAERFRVLGERVRAALGAAVLRVEHVGSTAVPGLAAKPIVDLDVVVQPADLPVALGRLASLGYRHEGNLGITGREAFRWPPAEERHHLYLCVPESAGLRDHLLFRDYLRSHPEVAQQYSALKRSLAHRYRDDRDRYQEAKAAFIEEVTRLATGAASDATGP